MGIFAHEVFGEAVDDRKLKQPQRGVLDVQRVLRTLTTAPLKSWN
jgi:hypothetical protein